MSIKGEDVTETGWPNLDNEAIVVHPDKYYPIVKQVGDGIVSYTVIGELKIWDISWMDDPSSVDKKFAIFTQEDLLYHDLRQLLDEKLATVMTKIEFTRYLQQLRTEGFIFANDYYTKYNYPQVFKIADRNYELQMQMIINRVVPESSIGKRISQYRKTLEETDY